MRAGRERDRDREGGRGGGRERAPDGAFGRVLWGGGQYFIKCLGMP